MTAHRALAVETAKTQKRAPQRGARFYCSLSDAGPGQTIASKLSYISCTTEMN